VLLQQSWQSPARPQRTQLHTLLHAAMSNSLTQHLDKARAEYDHANALMKHHQDEMKRMEQELKWAQV